MANTLPRASPDQTLLIDADDTLWEDNIYFERAFAAFVHDLSDHSHTSDEIRAVFNQVQRTIIPEYGYGVASFRYSLLSCLERLSKGPIAPERHERIAGFARSISEHEIELLPGVIETLPILASRHRLILMTKGDLVEQTGKLARSGLTHHFVSAEILHEKNLGAYRTVCEKYELRSDVTWMVGNSPKSDINPALAAGLHAVFIHNPNAWVLEHEGLAAPNKRQHLLELTNFSELGLYF